jgi:hypothetical protein
MIYSPKHFKHIGNPFFGTLFTLGRNTAEAEDLA